jgi:hypothetical protein
VYLEREDDDEYHKHTENTLFMLSFAVNVQGGGVARCGIADEKGPRGCSEMCVRFSKQRSVDETERHCTERNKGRKEERKKGRKEERKRGIKEERNKGIKEERKRGREEERNKGRRQTGHVY